MSDILERLRLREADGVATLGELSAIDEIERLEMALTDILNPMSYLERQAKRDGASLNSLAPSIANNIGTLQGIARNALGK